MTSDVSTVSLTRVASPSAAVEKALGMLGEPLRDLGRGDRAVIKPNIFQRPPGFQTSPQLLLALAKRASARGVKVYIAERVRLPADQGPTGATSGPAPEEMI